MPEVVLVFVADDLMLKATSNTSCQLSRMNLACIYLYL
jgi:hypothetical protein